MPRDGSGNYSLSTGNPVVPNTVISSSGWANPTLSDIAASLTASIAKDGQTTPTANLPMGNFRHTNVANAQNRNEYATAAQVQDGSLLLLTSVSGTDTITANLVPAITVYTAGQTFRFISSGANTTNAVTLNVNGLGAKAITKNGTTALAPGDIPASFVVDVTYDGTQFQIKSVSQYSAPVAFSTPMLNGNFDIWQRGTSFNSTGGQYTADMWQTAVVAGGATVVQTFSQQANTPGDTDCPYFFRAALAWTGTGALSTVTLQNRMEDTRTFAGQYVTLSFEAKADANCTIGADVSQNFGTGGSPSSSVVTLFPVINITTSWVRYKMTVLLPSVTGKTFGSNNDSYLTAEIGLASGGTGFGQTLPNFSRTIDIRRVRLDLGTVALPPEKRDPQKELASCQRYYERVGITVQVSPVYLGFPYKVTKRVPPTLSVTNGSIGTATIGGMVYQSQSAFRQTAGAAAQSDAEVGADASL